MHPLRAPCFELLLNSDRVNPVAPRLLTAKRLSLEHDNKQPSQAGKEKPPGDEAEPPRGLVNGGQTHREFLLAAKSLILGTLSSAEYEDVCRSLLGNNSYVLFTVDRVMDRLVRQLRLAASDADTKQVLDLYSYHRSHPVGNEATGHAYFANARLLLKEDEHIFRVEHRHPGQLSIQLMDWAMEWLPALGNDEAREEAVR